MEIEHLQQTSASMLLDEKSIFKPRTYQEELFALCVKRNTIIYLPTGAGKTHIAIMTIKHFAKDVLKPLNEGGKRTVFLVNTVALAIQQADYLKRSTNLNVQCYTGDMNIDSWTCGKWRNEFDQNQVIVATCQIVVDIILHGYISIQNLNLMIFDECHHARNNHPMHQLMEQFEKVEKEYQPRVIGLSAMLLFAGIKPAHVEKELKSLENVFQAIISTVSSYEDYKNVLVYSTKPTEKYIFFSWATPSYFEKSLCNQIGAFLENIVGKWKFHNNTYMSPKTLNWTAAPPGRFAKKVFGDFQHQLEDLGLFGSHISILSIIIDFELKKRDSESNDIWNFYRTCITFAEQIRQKIVYKMQTGTNDYTNSTDKVKKCLDYIQKFLNNAQDKNCMKCLVFVERRYTAKILYHILKTLDEKIKVDFIVGSSNKVPESYECVMEERKNRNTLEKFEKNELNVIVTTNVLAEGIDLQSCNLVIQYDIAKTYSNYNQTKGRARSPLSEYVSVIARDDSKQLSKINEFKLVDITIKNFLIGKTITRELPEDCDVEEELFENEIEPYFTQLGAKLTAVASIGMLYRYALSLPRDLYTEISLEWERIDVDKMKTVKVFPPIQCPLKNPIISESYANLKIAKRSAAFKTCVLLHKIGELSDNLMPIDTKKTIEKNYNIYFKLWDNYKNDNNQTSGSKKNKRQYNIAYPEELTNCQPQVNEECYLFNFKITPRFGKNDILGIQNVYHQLLSHSDSFGILTTKRLPLQLAQFPTFITIGKIDVEIMTQPIKICVKDSADMKKLINFHRMLFRDLLKINKNRNYVIHDNSNNVNSYIVVPTTNSSAINWSIVNDFQELSAPKVPTEDDRLKKNINVEEYLHKVVNPFYRHDSDHNFVVTQVLQNLSPLSSFPENQYKNYEHYYRQKYDIEIKHLDQQLIQVSGITTSLNRLNPGMDDKSRTHKLANRTRPEIYIPELCHNYMFPGNMWLKAVLLPSILHRLHYLLWAEYIRRSLSKYLDIDMDSDHQLPLELDGFQSNDVNKLALTLLPLTINHEGESVVKQDDIVINELNYERTAKTDKKCLLEISKHDIHRDINELTPGNLDEYIQIRDDFEGPKTKSIDLSMCINNDLNNPNICNSRNQPTFNEVQNKNPEIKILKMGKLYNSNKNIEFQQKDILQAITTRSSSDIFDQERYEVLGDAFLKFATSLFIFKNHPDLHEGHLTTLKGKIVSNRNLYYCGNELNLGGIIKIDRLDPRDNWMPPLFCLPSQIEFYLSNQIVTVDSLNQIKLDKDEIENGKPLDDKRLRDILNSGKFAPNENASANCFKNHFKDQSCGDKNIADTVEALLGVCVKTIGVEKSFNVLNYFKIIPEIDGNSTSPINQTIPCSLLRPARPGEIDEFLLNFKVLEKTLGYKFIDTSYLLQAVTHPSFVQNRITDCYQKLEFLGDSVLDFLITSYIFERCGDMNPGKLTDLRSSLVNNTTLACITVRNNLHLHLLSNSAALTETIHKFVQYQEKMNHKITDQVYLLINETDFDNKVNEVDSVVDFIDVPKALGDILESLIGAIFLDSNNNMDEVWRVIYNLMENEIKLFMKDVPIQIVRRLFEFPGASPTFSEPILRDGVAIVNLSFTCRNEKVSVTGVGQNKKNAERDAAKIALRKLYGKTK